MIPNSDITIYNKYVDPLTRTEKYQRTIVQDVVWQAAKAISRRSVGVISANVATILIPFALGANYLKPKAWNAAKSGKWTLQEGDVIVRGAITTDITTEYTVTDLVNANEEVVTITSVDAFDQGSERMRYWYVGCK